MVTWYPSRAFAVWDRIELVRVAYQEVSVNTLFDTPRRDTPWVGVVDALSSGVGCVTTIVSSAKYNGMRSWLVHHVFVLFFLQ